MSTPANPLASYRSYSYYHVLAICDCTETADNLALVTEEQQWRHPTEDQVSDKNVFARYGKYSPKEIKLLKESAQTGTVGNYCILIDGASDADVTITNFQYSAVTIAAATEYDRATSVAIEGTIKLSEPRGVSFLNTIVEGCQALSIDSAQAIFVLKTFFVGHAQDEETLQDIPREIVDVAPTQMMLYDVRGSFTESGGEYVIKFATPYNGIARLPQYSRSAEAFSVKAGTTLKSTTTNLEARINANYKRLYGCVQNTLANLSTISNAESINERISEVKYVIDLDPVYMSDLYTITSQAPEQKDEPACDSPGQIAVNAGLSIEDAIHLMMARCQKVQDEMGNAQQPNQPPGPKYTYKIESAYRSYPVQSSGNKRVEYVVTYTIKRFLEPKSINFLEELVTGTIPNETLLNNLIVFDYIYTGRNIDVLELDIKLNMGLQYLTIATMSNSTKGTNQYVSNRQTQIADDPGYIDRFTPKAQIPIFFSTDVQSPLFKNMQDTSSAIQAAYTMSKHASLEVSDASVTIAGNTLLLNATNAAGARRPTNASPQPFSEFASYPTIAQIKIRMPSNNDDIALMSAQTSNGESADYAKDYWFTGYYYVYGIEHIFDNGVFKQELRMIGMPDKDFATSIANVNNNRNEAAAQIDKCYDGNSIQPTPVEPHMVTSPPPVQPQQYPNFTVENTKSVVDGREYNIDDVKNYTKYASPELKAAIQSAASNKGVSPVLLAQIAQAESSTFDSKEARNPGKGQTASGPFQFIEKTWMGYVAQGLVPNTPPDTPRDVALQRRFEGKYAAPVAAQFMADNIKSYERNGVRDSRSSTNLYLAHLLGPSRSAKIVKAIEAGRGKGYVRDEIGASPTVSITSANSMPQGINITNDEIQAFAATRIARTLNNGVKVMPQGQAQPLPSAPAQIAPNASTSNLASSKTGTAQISKVVSKTLPNATFVQSGSTSSTSADRKSFVADFIVQANKLSARSDVFFKKSFNDRFNQYDSTKTNPPANSPAREQARSNFIKDAREAVSESQGRLASLGPTRVNALLVEYDKKLNTVVSPSTQVRCGKK